MFDLAKQNEITRVANSLWDDFLSTYSAKEDNWLYPNSPSSPNLTLLQFYKFCASIFVESERDPHITIGEDLSKVRGGDSKDRPASWLLVLKEKDEPAMPSLVVDTRILHECLGTYSPRGAVSTPIRARRYVILHEIGHLVLHWSSLCHQAEKTGRKYVEVEATHEAEAWWFAHSILGLTSARIAMSAKSKPSNTSLDSFMPVWQMILS